MGRAATPGVRDRIYDTDAVVRALGSRLTSEFDTEALRIDAVLGIH